MLNAEVLDRHLDPQRAPFLSFIPEVLEDPFEVWTVFDRHKGTGLVVPPPSQEISTTR